MNEHNPIAQLVAKIQQCWMKEVNPFPELALVRWLIEPHEAKLYEGFVHLESTPHGVIPEIFIVLLCPFQSKETFSRDLVNTWVEMAESDEKTLQAMAGNGFPFNWDTAKFRIDHPCSPEQDYRLLIELINSFKEAASIADQILNVVLLPYQISNIGEYSNWLENFLKEEYPSNTRMNIFDLKEERFFDPLFKKLNPEYAKTLSTVLDYQGAIHKIIQAGDPSQPGVRLQRYIQKMSLAVSDKNLEKLMAVGEACIAEMSRAKDCILLATAHITYAGMLFNFREYALIQEILTKGLAVTHRGAKEGDPSCQGLLIQYYNFQASNYHLSKQYKQAVHFYCKSAETAIEIKQFMQAVNGYRLAADVSKSHDTRNIESILEKSFPLKDNLSKEELHLSGFMSLMWDYCQFLEKKGKTQIREEVYESMRDLCGEDWEKEVRVLPTEKFQPAII